MNLLDNDYRPSQGGGGYKEVTSKHKKDIAAQVLGDGSQKSSMGYGGYITLMAVQPQVVCLKICNGSLWVIVHSLHSI